MAEVTEHKEFSSTSFLSPSAVVKVIPGNEQVEITTLYNKVFLARHGATHIEVYDSDNFATTPNLLKISDKPMRYPVIISSAKYDCLFVCHEAGGESEFYRIQLDDSSSHNWTVNGHCTGLAMTPEGNLLATFSDMEESPDPERVSGVREFYISFGTLASEVKLDDRIDDPKHCVQLSDGNFVVGACGSSPGRVFVVDNDGHVLKFYDESPAFEDGHLAGPFHLAVDRNDNVFVTDYANDKVQLLTRDLTHIDYVQTPGYDLQGPLSLHLDEMNRRLFIGEAGGRVLVVDFSNKGMEPDEAGKESFWKSFLSESRVLHKLRDTKRDYPDIALIGRQLFLVRYEGSHVDVYDSNKLDTPSSQLSIGTEWSCGAKIAACSENKCLYVSVRLESEDETTEESVVHCIDLSDSSITKWTVKGKCGGLSVSNDHHLLVTISDQKCVREYDTRGGLVREVVLDESMEDPSNCYQLLDGNFVVNHSSSDAAHRVCKVDASGKILKSYGGRSGSDDDQLNCPMYMSVTGSGHVFVADVANARVVLLSPALRALGIVKIPGHYLQGLCGVYVDEINHRLYVVDDGGKNLLVLGISSASESAGAEQV